MSIGKDADLDMKPPRRETGSSLMLLRGGEGRMPPGISRSRSIANTSPRTTLRPDQGRGGGTEFIVVRG